MIGEPTSTAPAPPRFIPLDADSPTLPPAQTASAPSPHTPPEAWSAWTIGGHRFRSAPPTYWTPPAIIEDTREQHPLPFHLLDPRDALPVIRGGLELGDYSAIGMEADLFVERKALPDLVGSVTHDRRRFEDELAAAASMPFRWRLLVVVGANPSRSCEIQLETGEWRSLATGRSVRASLDAFAVRYGLTVRLCDSPLSAAAFVARTVRACARRLADARWTQRGFHARNEARRAAKEAAP